MRKARGTDSGTPIARPVRSSATPPKGYWEVRWGWLIPPYGYCAVCPGGTRQRHVVPGHDRPLAAGVVAPPPTARVDGQRERDLERPVVVVPLDRSGDQQVVLAGHEGGGQPQVRPRDPSHLTHAAVLAPGAAADLGPLPEQLGQLDVVEPHRARPVAQHGPQLDAVDARLGLETDEEAVPPGGIGVAERRERLAGTVGSELRRLEAGRRRGHRRQRGLHGVGPHPHRDGVVPPRADRDLGDHGAGDLDGAVAQAKRRLSPVRHRTVEHGPRPARLQPPAVRGPVAVVVLLESRIHDQVGVAAGEARGEPAPPGEHGEPALADRHPLDAAVASHADREVPGTDLGAPGRDQSGAGDRHARDEHDGDDQRDGRGALPGLEQGEHRTYLPHPRVWGPPSPVAGGTCARFEASPVGTIEAFPLVILVTKRCILVATIASLMVAALAPMPASAVESFTFYGSGWGHRIGMSQYGALGLAQKGLARNAILQSFYTNVTIGQAPSPPSQIRVGLFNTVPSIRLKAVDAGVALRLGSTAAVPIVTIPAGQTWTVEVLSAAYRIKREDGTYVGTTHGNTTTKLYATYAGAGAGVYLPGTFHTYRRGFMEFNLHQSCLTCAWNLRLIIVLAAEGYMMGLGEVPSSWPAQALQAQAVAGRSYAFAKVRDSGQSRSPCNCGLYASTLDQVYVGSDKELGTLGENWVAAVEDTTGLVALHSGSTITAFYSSSSGGLTESNADVWGGAPLPYLGMRCDAGDFVTSRTRTASGPPRETGSPSATASSPPPASTSETHSGSRTWLARPADTSCP